MQQGAAAVVTHGESAPAATRPFVLVLIGSTDWTQSLFSEDGGYVVPIGPASIT